MGRINQQELARMLQLSQTTVSRSLANHPAINAETKAMVLEAAAKMGYSGRIKRNQNASGLNAGPMVWGVVISIPKQFSGPSETFQQILRGIADRSSLQDSILDVVFHEPGEKGTSRLTKRIRSAKWKGSVLIHPIEHGLAHEIAHQGACVSIIENYRHDLIDSIDVDQAEAIHALVGKLHEKGHRRIAFLTWTYHLPTPWVMHRFGSYVEALYRCGLDFNPSHAINIRKCDRAEPGGCAEQAAGLIRDHGVTAVVCAADHQAYRLIADLESMGFRIPDDVSITGFDGIPPVLVNRQVATVKVPYEELGRSAIHQLLRRLEQPTAPRRHILVDGDLLEGDTIAPPRA
ncbi:MAG: LacI family DNA-binding transcriptional regulator [Oceanipulchritudo sp.]